MKNSLMKSSILALSLVMAATGSNAASNQSPAYNGQHDCQPLTASELITKLDTNNDNRLSKTEAKGPLSRHFTEIDNNSDGYLTEAELEANKPKGNMRRGKHHKGQPPSATELISKMDTNNDNRLSYNEAKGPLSQHFSEIDSNNDGYLTQSELENAPKPDRQRR